MPVLKFFALSAFVLVAPLTVARANSYEIASDLIGLYQPMAREKYGSEVYLIIGPSKEPNAYASFNGPMGAPRIQIHAGLLEWSPDDNIAATVCHELGHFFGDHSFGEREPGITIEGEADYFSGSCLVRYLSEVRGRSAREAEEHAIAIATSEAENFEGRRLEPESVRSRRYDGISQSYPKPECRLLTVIHGVRNLPRPTCWFNP